jgi:hypothetical protein
VNREAALPPVERRRRKRPVVEPEVWRKMRQILFRTAPS